RTMTAEVEVANPDLELVPGMYASVVLRVQRRPQVLCIPPEALTSAQKQTVYVVNRSQEVEERNIKLGLETSDALEVTSGLTEGDLVLIGNHSQLKAGQKVEAKLIGAVAQK